MRATLLAPVPAGAVSPPVEAGDLLGAVPVDDYRPGDRVAVVLPGGRVAGGILLEVAGAWWLLGEHALIALAPGMEVVRLLLFRPI